VLSPASHGAKVDGVVMLVMRNDACKWSQTSGAPSSSPKPLELMAFF